MTVTRPQQQALFALNAKGNVRLPLTTPGLPDGNIAVLIVSSMEQPFRVTIDPSGAIVALEAQATSGKPVEDRPWTDILGAPGSLQYRYVEFFGKLIAAALEDAEALASGFYPELEAPEGARALTSIPADAMAALADPAKALKVAQTAAHPDLVEELAESIYVTVQTDSVTPSPRKSWRALDYATVQNGYRSDARAILTAIATTGNPCTVNLPGATSPTKQAAHAAMLFSKYWVNR